MIIPIVVVTVLVFVIVDLLLRLVLRRIDAWKKRRERERALETALRIDYTDEANSLKRVEVTDPRARILAVDDEAIVLDSFRKILVVAGYSVDTVESGREALGLVRKHAYDFVFTDFKMPDMDGVEVTKGVKQLRPDVDVVMITGYASIESAVETMKHGAMDYVEKPFTAQELTDFVAKLVIRREARLEKEIQPTIHLVTPSVRESESRHEFNVPAGIFVSNAHSWVGVHMNGLVRVGLDDFTQKMIGKIDAIVLPDRDQKVAKGDELFVLRHGPYRLAIPSPVSGRVMTVNEQLRDSPELIKLKPYELGWICTMDPQNLTVDLRDLRIGNDAVTWYEQEIGRCTGLVRQAIRDYETKGSRHETRDGNGDVLEDVTWEVFAHDFIQR